MKLLTPFLLLFLLVLPAHGQLEPRIYSFTNTPPAVVEKEIKAYVRLPHRVKLSPERGQVMVIANPETHAKIAERLKRMDRPHPNLDLWMRVGADDREATVMDGQLFNILLTDHPPSDLEELGKARLAEGQRNRPLRNSAMQVHAKVLRENPLIVQLRITPALVYGKERPYQPVYFPEYRTDILVNGDKYISFLEAFGKQDPYRPFFREQTDPNLPPVPLDVLLAVEGLSFASSEKTP